VIRPDKSRVTVTTDVLARLLVVCAVTHLFVGPLSELDLLDWACVGILSVAVRPIPKEGA
jgi:hypothetical protein